MLYKTHYWKVWNTVANYKSEAVHDGSLAAELHAYYNNVGLKEGWLEKQYATPLSEQDQINQVKNVEAAADVVKFWDKMFSKQKGLLHKEDHLDIIRIMQECIVAYLEHKPNAYLDSISESQHKQWQKYTKKHELAKVTAGSSSYDQDDATEFKQTYAELPEIKQDQDRLVVAVITDRILELADIGHKRWINI